MGNSLKTPFRLLILLFIVVLTTGNLRATPDIAPDSARVIPEKGTVSRISENRLTTVPELGLNLENGDEIITDEKSRATVLLSMLSEFDEILVGPASRIRISIIASDSYRSIYQIHILYGKIRVSTQLSKSKQVLFSTSLAEITADEGEFILQSSKKGTIIGVLKNMARVTSIVGNIEFQVSEKTMLHVSHFKAVSPMKMFVNSLFEGVEKSSDEVAGKQ